MLKKLEIRNLAIVEHAFIDFDKGFNVITGETGAGKSILVNSIAFLAGKRASSKDVRSGSKEASVVAFVDVGSKHLKVKNLLTHLGLEFNAGQLEIKRVLSIEGRGKVWINNAPCSVSTLVELAKYWIDMTTQHAQHQLLNSKQHLNMLDGMGTYKADIESYQSIFLELKKVDFRIRSFEKEAQDFERDKDYLSFQLEELKKVSISEEEESGLESKIAQLSHKEEMQSSFSSLTDMIESEGGLLDVFQKSLSELKKLSKFGETYESAFEEGNELLSQLEAWERSFLGLEEDVLLEDEDLEDLNQKLSDLQKLKRKYGSLEAAFKERDRIKQLFDDFEDAQFTQENLLASQKMLCEKLSKVADVLHRHRQTLGDALAKEISKELKGLGMEQADLFMDWLAYEGDGAIKYEAYSFGPEGAYDMQIMFCPNPGEGFKALDEIASGGELSRILLAIKSCSMGGADYASMTYLFDEVDTGIGGHVAERVGIHLKKLSLGKQVLCVTHLAQVACYGDMHFHVQKISANDRTQTQFERLDMKNQEQELARMIGGIELTEKVYEHARELVTRARSQNL